MAKIYPSLIAANLLNLEQEIKQLEPYCEGYHLDIMDDHFVPNLTFGADIVKSIDNLTPKPLWVQLMVDNPEKWIELLSVNANSIITFHLESHKEITKLVNSILNKKVTPSVAINPKTPVEQIFPLLDIIHHVVIMSVEPGFSGQPFLPEVVEKVLKLSGYCQMRGLKCTIGIDGGVGQDNIAMLAEKGVEDFAIGSAIFDKRDRVDAIKKLHNLVC